jgi:acetylglutamate kinase
VLDAENNLISSLSATTVEKMIADQRITGGMIPKIECALESLRAGVQKVPIINGKRPHAILLELFTDKGIGTEVTL